MGSGTRRDFSGCFAGEADARSEWAETNAEVRRAYEQLEWERESLKMSQRWGGFNEDELAECQALIAAAEARVSDAEAALAALRVQQERAA